MKLLLTAILLILSANVVAAEETGQRATSVGVDYSQEKLSIDSPDWHERTLRVQHQFEKRHGAGMELADIERFGLRDTRLGLNYTRPLDSQLTATVDVGYSPTHRVIARHTLGAALQVEFAPAWLLHVGGRTTAYDGVTVNQAMIGLERYVANYSWIVNLRPAQAFGRTIYSGDIRGSYYYGNKNSVTLIAAAGEEAALVGSTVSIAQLRAVAITGRHWLDHRWAVSYGASHTHQGDFYSRNGINLGIQYTF